MNNGLVCTPRWFGIEYDFDKDGGAVGTIETGLILPAGGALFVTAVQKITQCVGAGATFQFGTASSVALYGSYPSALFPATGMTTPMTVSTLEEEVLITIAGVPITQGKIHVHWCVIIGVGRD